jgi:succinoglycan biosynthesis transport protein ExoP
VSPEDEEVSLREYLRVVQRRKWTVILLTLLTMSVALVASYLQTPVYSATAEVLVRPRVSEIAVGSGALTESRDPRRVLQTEIRISESSPVREMAQAKLGYGATASASAAGETDVILITGHSVVPSRAANIANAFASSYVEFKRKQIVDEFLAAVNEVQAQIDDVQRQIDTSVEPLRSTLIQRKTLFEGQRDQLKLDASLRSGGVQPMSEAVVPTSPVRPKPLRSGVIGFMIGFILGIGLAFLLEFLDDTIKDKSDLERVAPAVPVLGLIPTVPTWRVKEEVQLISLSEPSSPVAEAYRTLRTSVQFLGMDKPVQVVQLTSPSASEGKTTTLANLAVAMARAGRRVVVVCCDLRRPRVHEFFGLSNRVGFTSVLLGEVGLSQALQKVPNVDRLFVLASGPLPPNPSELLSSRRAVEVLDALRADGNLLLLDSPPILPVTDGLILSRQADATLLVSIAGGTTKKDASRAIEMLEQVEAPLAGVILNGVSPDSSYGYSYGYYRAAETMKSNGNGATSAGATNGRSRRSRRQASEDEADRS